jgi:hypothetical protein
MLIFALKDLSLSVPPLIFVLAFIGTIKMFLDKKMALAISFILWLMPLFYFGNLSIYSARYLTLVIIPVYVFSSYALANICKKSRVIPWILIAYFLFSMFVFMFPMLRFRHRLNGQKRFARYVKVMTPANALIIAADEGPFISYYGQRQVLLRPLHQRNKEGDFLQEIKGYLKSNQPVYLVSSALEYGSNDAFADALHKEFAVELVGWYLNEDYHRPELSFRLFFEKLFKLSLKKL